MEYDIPIYPNITDVDMLNPRQIYNRRQHVVEPSAPVDPPITQLEHTDKGLFTTISENKIIVLIMVIAIIAIIIIAYIIHNQSDDEYKYRSNSFNREQAYVQSSRQDRGSYQKPIQQKQSVSKEELKSLKQTLSIPLKPVSTVETKSESEFMEPVEPWNKNLDNKLTEEMISHGIIANEIALEEWERVDQQPSSALQLPDCKYIGRSGKQCKNVSAVDGYCNIHIRKQHQIARN